MGIVTFNLEIFEPIVKDRGRFTLDDELWQGTRFTGQLQARLIEVVAVQMGISTSPDKITHFQVTLLRHHMHQQCVAGDVEWQTQEDIA